MNLYDLIMYMCTYCIKWNSFKSQIGSPSVYLHVEKKILEPLLKQLAQNQVFKNIAFCMFESFNKNIQYYIRPSNKFLYYDSVSNNTRLYGLVVTFCAERALKVEKNMCQCVTVIIVE